MKKQKQHLTNNYFEKKAWQKNLYVCGIDEVGRGCLAGPLVVAAAIIPQGTDNPLLQDSKVLSSENREAAYAWITSNCYWSVASASHRVIDRINIYQATLMCMKKAYLQLSGALPEPQEKIKYVLVDAMPLHLDNGPEVKFFNYGEQWSQSIAAASIIAKVTRDNLMEKMCHNFPAYTLEKHKGYATKSHTAALIEHGPSLIHRTTFLSKINKKRENPPLQQSLF